MKIHLLGSPKVVLKSGQAASISSDSEHALLAYLAVDKSRDHQRESLSALLWPETEAKQARSNLRVTLHRLRRALQDESGEIIQTSKQALQLNWQADLWLDVDVFVQLLDEVDNHPHGHLAQCQPCADRLAEAVSLYQGDFLQGLIVEDSLLFQEWTIFNQEWLQRKMLAGLHAADGDPHPSGEFQQGRTACPLAIGIGTLARGSPPPADARAGFARGAYRRFSPV